MRRLVPFLFVVAVTVAVVVGKGVPGRPAEPSPKAEPPKEAEAALQYQGVASCAAAACHNGNGPRGSKGSEYTTWIAHDPHSRASSILKEARSKTIEKNYRRLKSVTEAHAEEDALCLQCHVQPGFSSLNKHERFSLIDGVGCEACHGPAEKWLTRHYQDDWKTLTASERQALGLTDTRNLRARAEACVGCHVGHGDADVNHDLIAAGHPRLRFEYSAYLARYPRHWRISDERRRYPDFEARAWEEGQLASAAAALELLHVRATRPGAPWPEFAELECAACHHDLQEPATRPQPALTGRRPGTAPWGTWYYSLLPVLERGKEGKEPQALSELQELDKLMIRRVPDSKQVGPRAQRAAAALRLQLLEREKVGVDEKRLAQMLKLLASEERTATNWDSAAQLYLGLTALNQGLQNVAPDSRGLAEGLPKLRRRLEEAFPQGRENIYQLPSRFDSVAFQRELQSLRQQGK